MHYSPDQISAHEAHQRIQELGIRGDRQEYPVSLSGEQWLIVQQALEAMFKEPVEHDPGDFQPYEDLKQGQPHWC